MRKHVLALHECSIVRLRIQIDPWVLPPDIPGYPQHLDDIGQHRRKLDDHHVETQMDQHNFCDLLEQDREHVKARPDILFAVRPK